MRVFLFCCNFSTISNRASSVYYQPEQKKFFLRVKNTKLPEIPEIFNKFSIERSTYSISVKKGGSF